MPGVRQTDAGVVLTSSGAAQTVVSEIPDTEIDFFEDGDISEYTGFTSRATVVSNKSFDGDNSLEIDSLAGGTFDLTSTSGLQTYPSRGDLFTIRLFFDSSATDIEDLQFDVAFFVSSSPYDDNSGYIIEFHTRGGTNELKLQRSDSGSPTTVTSTPLSAQDLATDQWSRLDIDTRTGDDIEVTYSDENLNEIASVSGTDGNYDSGGIAYGEQSGDADGKKYVDTFGIK